MSMLDSGKKIIKRLNDNGKEAYFVGGFVRDSIMGLEPNDIDITTNALPSDLVKIFPQSDSYAIDYNSVRVKEDNYTYEITTYRKDISYKNHRHPVVEYVDTIEEDLKRRDFTINAMAMDISGDIIDLYNGQDDIKNRLIRTVGNPDIRFKEDALRILRAFYFASKLNFQIESKTYEAIVLNASLVEVLSSVRILDEIGKILKSPYSLIGFKYLKETKVADFLPSLKCAVDYIIYNRIENLDLIEFLIIAFYLDDSKISFYNITKTTKKTINSIIEVLKAKEESIKYMLYKMNIKEIDILNHVAKILNKEINYLHEYEALPIHEDTEVALSRLDICKILSKEPGKWLNEIYDLIIIEILECKLINKQDDIITFIKTRIKE